MTIPNENPTPGHDERAAIAATLEAYIGAIRHNDADTMKQIFHPQAILSRHRPDGFLISTNPGEVIGAYMRSRPPIAESSPRFSGRILAIEQAGDMASAHILENELEGSNFVTFFHLHKVEGRWVITSKATRATAVVSS